MKKGGAMFGKSERLWKKVPLNSVYDAVILGGGIHGLSAAFFLAREQGMTRVAVIEKDPVGFQSPVPHTALFRADQRTPETLLLHREGLGLWKELSRELDFNLMLSESGILNLAHSEKTLRDLRIRAASMQLMNIESRMADPRECKELVPALDISARGAYPILGGMYHPQGGTVCPESLLLGLARGAAGRGVHIHQKTAVSAIGIEKGKIFSVDTDKGSIRTRRVLNAGGDYSPYISAMAGIRLPVQMMRVQTMISQPVPPLLNSALCSDEYIVNQTLRGEIILRGYPVPGPDCSCQSEPRMMKHQATAVTEILPCLKGLKIMRAYSSPAEITPDRSPIADGNDPIEGYFMICGSEFAAGPVLGRYMAEFIASGCRPGILSPFSRSRFETYSLTGENYLSPVITQEAAQWH